MYVTEFNDSNEATKPVLLFPLTSERAEATKFIELDQEPQVVSGTCNSLSWAVRFSHA